MIRYLLTLLAFVIFLVPAKAQNKARFSDIKPGMQIGWVERDAIKVANERAVNLRCPEEYTKAKIISRDWDPERYRDGFIKGRSIHIELYCEFPDGHCGMADYIFNQKLMGDGEYSRKLQFAKVGDMYTVDCEPSDR